MDWSEIYGQIIRFLPRWEIINPDEVGVHLRFGKLKACLDPGVYFCLPYFDEIFKFTSVSQIVNIPPQSVRSMDTQETMAVTCSVTFYVFDAERAFLLIDDLDEQIRCHIGGLISQYISNRTDLNEFDLSNYVMSASGDYLAARLGIRMESVNVLDMAPHKIIRLMSGLPLQVGG